MTEYLGVTKIMPEDHVGPEANPQAAGVLGPAAVMAYVVPENTNQSGSRHPVFGEADHSGKAVPNTLSPDDLDRALQYYLQGGSEEDFHKRFGLDPSVITAHLDTLPPDERQYLMDARRAKTEGFRAKEKLKSTQPELFEGRIPAEQEETMRVAGHIKYAVGFMQYDAISEWSEARACLNDEGGVSIANDGLNQRFLLHDREHPMEDYPMGYYTSRMGRFVYAFPVAENQPNNDIPLEQKESYAPRNAAALETGLPDDMFLEDVYGERVVSRKYCVGFIDSDQIFHANPTFMSEKSMEDAEFELGVREKIRAIRSKVTGDEPLKPEDSEKIDALVASVKARRQAHDVGNNGAPADLKAHEPHDGSRAELRAEIDDYVRKEGTSLKAVG